jgi:hypothetical protein
MTHIDGVMVSMLASSVVDRGFEPRLGITKDCKIGIGCFSAKLTALRRTKTGWLWMVLFQNGVRQLRSPAKMATTVQLRCY